jgi:excisionase family DNA binding protein
VNASALTLQEAADHLGVHYMTAYKYVRTGKLPATKSGSEWRILRDDLEAFASRPTPPSGRSTRGQVNYAERLIATLIQGDEAASWSVLEGAMASGSEPEVLYLTALAPAMREIGDRWERGVLTVAEEHRAAAVMQRLVGRLGPMMRRAGRTRGTVVIGAPSHDAHSLPVAMLADLLRRRGVAVVDLGADVPVESFAEAVETAPRLLAVAITVSTPDNETAIGEIVRAIRRLTSAPVLVGGVSADADLAASVSADTYLPSGLDAVAHVALLRPTT